MIDHCPTCGYDTRGLDHCPECGTALSGDTLFHLAERHAARSWFVGMMLIPVGLTAIAASAAVLAVNHTVQHPARTAFPFALLLWIAAAFLLFSRRASVPCRRPTVLATSILAATLLPALWVVCAALVVWIKG